MRGTGREQEIEPMTTDLLDLAVAAHGGLDRWREARTIELDLSIGGAIWYVKGCPDVLRDISMRVGAGEEYVTTTYADRDLRTTFRPDLVTVERQDGTVIERFEDPERAFQDDGPWTEVHVAYFSGEALWTYLNVPFLYTRDDFATEEIEPIEVGGERWRRLRVTFPESVKSHTREQISCFGPDGLLRRHDYTVDILGGATGLNYADGYREAGGILFPARRRVYAYEGDYRLVPEPLLVSIDIRDIRIQGA
jgi:hypothetical protein